MRLKCLWVTDSLRTKASPLYQSLEPAQWLLCLKRASPAYMQNPARSRLLSGSQGWVSSSQTSQIFGFFSLHLLPGSSLAYLHLLKEEGKKTLKKANSISTWVIWLLVSSDKNIHGIEKLNLIIEFIICKWSLYQLVALSVRLIKDDICLRQRNRYWNPDFNINNSNPKLLNCFTANSHQ